MRNAVAACGTCALLGLGGGWVLRGQPAEKVRYVVVRGSESKAPLPTATNKTFPEHPKPPLDTPTAVAVDQTPASPTPLVGNLPALPNTSSNVVLSGPLSPDNASKLPVADLNADEALAKRLILGSGGEIISASDAKDASGKVGRTLVAETEPQRVSTLQGSLRAALHDRVVMSDAGTVGGSTPELQKAEESLAATEKALDRARVDFLPQAPVLHQMEEDYAKQQQSVSAIRRRIARRRINVMIRPGLSLP